MTRQRVGRVARLAIAVALLAGIFATADLRPVAQALANLAWWWLPVLEVGYSLSPGKRLEPPVEGCDLAHESAETLVFTSLAVAIPAQARTPEETVKIVLPPTRWPLGGRVEEETDPGAGNNPPAPKD